MIADAIRQAQQMHRRALEETWEGSCRIFERRAVKDPDTKVTRMEEVSVGEGIPCRLSFAGTGTTQKGETMATVPQTVRLFLAPEPVIHPGCRIEVTQRGRTESYAQSGKAAVYVTHQEIPLELWKGYA